MTDQMNERDSDCSGVEGRLQNQSDVDQSRPQHCHLHGLGGHSPDVSSGASSVHRLVLVGKDLLDLV